MARRDFSPPESERIFLSTSSPENWKAPASVRSEPMSVLREILLQLLDDGEVGIEHVERLLGEVAHREAGAEADAAGIGLDGAGDHFEQRGLPRPVAAHHRPALAAADGQVEAVVDHARAVALVQVLDDRHLVAGARRHAEFELHHVALLGQFDLLDLVERLDAALHLRGLGGVRAEAVDEALLLGEHGLLAGEGGLLIGLADGALALVEIVVAGVGDDLAGIDLGDLGDDAVHELAVVRGHQQRALDRILRNCSSQMMDSRSRWLVGSSISRTSGRPSSTRARATRIFQPPESAPTSPSI